MFWIEKYTVHYVDHCSSLDLSRVFLLVSLPCPRGYIHVSSFYFEDLIVNMCLDWIHS